MTTQIKIRNKWRKNQIKISQQLRDIIHGYIMSDGYVNQRGCLTVDQGVHQENFVEWLSKVFGEIRTDHEIQIVCRQRKGKNPTYSKRFNTKSLLKGFHKMWYTPYTDINGKAGFKKRLPKSLNCFFNSTFLTLWFAGDGTKIIGSQGVKIEVTNYTPKERLRLKALFKQKFQIEAKINKAGRSKTGTEQWTININAEDYPKFRSLILKMDLIQNIFPHKLHPKIKD